MTGWTSRLLFSALTGAGLCAAGAAYSCEIVEFLPDAAADGAARYDEMAPFNRFEAAALANPSSDVMAFLQYVQKTYLPNERLGIFHLRSADMAKLFGYAIGEAATHPAPIDVFSPQFTAEFENWIVRLGVYGEVPLPGGGPGVANQMWRLVQEGARGFYDEEMRAAYGSLADDAGPVSVNAWFKSLSDAEQQQVLERAAKAGLVRANGAPYSIAEFEALSVLIDGQFERQGYSAATRRRFIGELAAGRFDEAAGE